MKRIARQFTNPKALVVAVALLAFMVFASPSPSRAAAAEPGQKKAARVSKVDRTEARIQMLHAKLKITPAQEEQWNKVTQVMRDNAKTMEALIKTRLEKEGTLSAVEDLKSYGAIADAHAESIRKFIPVFEPLYAGMSDTQKKDADKLFHHGGGDHKKSKAKAK